MKKKEKPKYLNITEEDVKGDYPFTLDMTGTYPLCDCGYCNPPRVNLTNDL